MSSGKSPRKDHIYTLPLKIVPKIAPPLAYLFPLQPAAFPILCELFSSEEPIASVMTLIVWLALRARRPADGCGYEDNGGLPVGLARGSAGGRKLLERLWVSEWKESSEGSGEGGAVQGQAAPLVV